MSGILKNLLMVLGILIVGAAGYYIYTTQGMGELDIAGVGGIDSQVLANTQLFIERRSVLESLDLSTDLFDDPRFAELRSFNTELPDLPVGRENPFLPPEEVTPLPTQSAPDTVVDQ